MRQPLRSKIDAIVLALDIIGYPLIHLPFILNKIERHPPKIRLQLHRNTPVTERYRMLLIEDSARLAVLFIKREANPKITINIAFFIFPSSSIKYSRTIDVYIIIFFWQ